MPEQRPEKDHTAASLIAAERRRQIVVEGWTPEHDDEHGPRTLARAARCYEQWDPNTFAPWPVPPREWPWGAEWFKPKGTARNLIRAGALYLAAAEAAARSGDPEPLNTWADCHERHNRQAVVRVTARLQELIDSVLDVVLPPTKEA